MSYLKRQRMPKNWPVPRKGTAYVIKSSFGLEKGVPLLIALRDMLKVVKNRKELKKAIHEKKVSINGRLARDEKETVQLFDKIGLIPSKKYYKLNLSNKGKFVLEEIKESEANQKVAKIINKKILKGKKVQLNLSDGRNFIAETKCKVNDSVSINFKDKKITKCLPLEKGAKIVVFAGKHAGERGTLVKLKPERKMASLKIDKKEIDILIKQIMVTD
jgi:small subunit ribosomal protein S4e